MTIDEIGSLTFQELDRRKGFVPQLPDVSVTGPTYTDEWYASIYTTPLRDLTDDDLSHTSTHGWMPEYFVPLSLVRLRERPFIGVYYDGQLLLNLGQTPAQFWRDHPELMSDFRRILNNAIQRIKTDADGLTGEGLFVDEETAGKIIDLSIILSCR